MVLHTVRVPVSGEQEETNGTFSSWHSGMSFSGIMSYSFLASLLSPGSSSNTFDGVRLFLLGTLMELGRRFFTWIYERFNVFQYSVTAEFDGGDPIYEWIILYLTEAKVWKRSRNFHVSFASSKRKWRIKPASRPIDSTTKTDANADYVPTYEDAQLFRWKGYWAEIKRSKETQQYNDVMGYHLSSKLYLTIYSRDMSVLSDFVGEARDLYMEKSQPHVVVHSLESNNYDPVYPWTNTTAKSRRSLNSIILPEGVLSSIVEDAKEFLSSEDWYTVTGIPHRRGYLLYGPPGTGKSSTIYAIAGELNLEIYCISLASKFIDDSFLMRALRSIPKRAIFLIEDIDCAFTSREELEGSENQMGSMSMFRDREQNKVTLSGLLNVLDGVGSEEGKIFFATTNYIDRLDPALLRPGRIDKKVQYYLSTKSQAQALFSRFYPPAMTTINSALIEDKSLLEKFESPPTTLEEKEAYLAVLASKFAEAVPEEEFSTAELQGYLLSCKKDPERALAGIFEWVAFERRERKEQENKAKELQDKTKEKRDLREAEKLHHSLAFLQNANATGVVAGEAVQSGTAASPPSIPLLGNGVATRSSPSPIPTPAKKGANLGDTLNDTNGASEDEALKS